jgi:hypothetical protein
LNRPPDDFTALQTVAATIFTTFLPRAMLLVDVLGAGSLLSMRHVAAALAVVGAVSLAGSRPAAADILVNISKTSQRMAVLVDGSARYNWLVSTGSARHTTPSGVHQPQWLARKWRSKQYGNAPMPHSIFFRNGYAIHGTTEVARLGKIASHGCIRLHPENAAKLYALVEKQMAQTTIVVSNDALEPPGQPPKKPGLFVAENVDAERPAVASNSEPALAVEKTENTREAAKPPVRVRTAARASAGFRW